MRRRGIRDRGPAWGLVGIVLLAAVLSGCDGDDLTNPNLLDRELVVGTYDPTTLTFDVAGPTFGEYDLLAALQVDDVPPLLFLATDGSVQLVYLDPSTNKFEIGEGTYSMLEDGVRIRFRDAVAPNRILLPQTLDLVYDEGSGILRFGQESPVPLARLVALVPELDGEPLSDPVGGILTVELTPR